MIAKSSSYPYRIGVDVGGTNTDAVIVDTSIKDPAKSIVACQKSPTTSPNVTGGIEAALRSVLQSSQIDINRISSLAIGTTHFINAIIERDARHLSKVAVIRITKSFTREVPPFSDFPDALRVIMHGYHGFIDGGLQIDGRLEAPVVRSQVVEQCNIIRTKGIKSIVISGVFSPLDSHFCQEDTVRKIINRELPDALVVCSSEVSGIGFLERENASILNASILQFSRRTIREFETSLRRLKLRCALYLTQNDGTLIDSKTAGRLPIRTFSSGPTNSMRGAAYLNGMDSSGKGNVTTIVCDIGGTTSDVGIVLPSGYPRQGMLISMVAGVRVNYGMPHVESIGLGGGSIVRKSARGLTLGPDSVGYALTEKSLSFGGDTMTATDIAVAGGIDTALGGSCSVPEINPETTRAARLCIKSKLEMVTDLVKTSPDALDLIVVGGGAIIAPAELKGITRVIRPPYYNVANAVGAAIARISATVDIIQSTAAQTVGQVIEIARNLAKDRVIEAGVLADTVMITEQESLPLPYVENQMRVVVKAVGDFSPAERISNRVEDSDDYDTEPVNIEAKTAREEIESPEKLDIGNYKPQIVKNITTGIEEWIISPTDLEWLADGCYVLGCGGGGTPYPEMLKLKGHIQDGHNIRVIDAEDLSPDARIYWAGNMGSPAVPAERLSANESIEAIKEMMDYCGHPSFDAAMGLEIGGSNGLLPLTVGSSKNFGLPAVDADWMGRAYPNLWQITLAVQEKGQMLPCAISSVDGRSLIMTKAKDDKIIDRTLRAPAIEMGYYVGLAAKPTTTALVQKWSVRCTLSQAWRIGRCIALAGANNTVSTVADQIIEEVGGRSSGKVLYHGKITGVERRLYRGHSHGEVVIEPVPADVQEDDRGHRSVAVASGGTLRIPFMNENLIAKHLDENGVQKVVASVPDLIIVLDANTGKALGIGEYRYGIVVNVLGITCSPVWSGNAAGLAAGGPEAFGYDDISYTPLGVYEPPQSVIRQYS